MSKKEGEGYRLLVVDDNEDNRDMLARRLRRRGFEVETAEDGLVALAMIDTSSFDLVLLDIMMPGLSGLEVLAKLRETFPRAELPILMATAKSESTDMVEALKLGANDYVTKPIDFPVALARVMAHLQTRQQAPSLPAPAMHLPADGRAAPGSVLDGRYEVHEIIGEGGFANVFRCKQLSTGQVVAVKVLRSPDIVQRKRFEREMRLIGKLNHPHVVRLIDFGRLQARVAQELWSGGGEGFEDTTETRHVVRKLPYIVMEYVEGPTLGELVKAEGPLPIQEAIALMLPVLSAVSAAHDAGVVHRDLKPPNILVAKHGSLPEPKVLDFGIAKPNDEESNLTQGESILGTPEYMAPEQIRETREADERSDQYALGCILYECLTGKRAFRAASFVELLQAVSSGAFETPSKVNDAIPDELERVVLRAMDLDPDRRYKDLLAFGNALLPFASAEVRARWSLNFSTHSDSVTDPGVHDRPTKEAGAPAESPTETEGKDRHTDPVPDEPVRADTPVAATPAASPTSVVKLGIALLVVGLVLVAAAIAIVLG